VIGVVPQTAVGVNTAVWDSNLLDPSIPSLLKAAGVRVLRFPGGSTSDVYHWRTHALTANSGYLNRADNFDAFMGVAQKVGATPIITVNYGSNAAGTAGGDPSEAAGWVNYANNVKHYGVKFWEIGNEVYGNGFYGADWEEDLHAPDNPNHTGRKGNPGLGPDVYGRNAAAFIRAMKAQDPSIKVGVFLIQPGNWPDGVAPDWNSTVLAQCGGMIDFAIVHLYPEQPGKESDAGLLSSTSTIPASVASLRALLDHDCGANAKNVSIFLTETNSVTFNPGKQSVSIVNALFLPDDYMSWLEAGVVNIDWWDLHNGAGTGNNNSPSLHGSASYGDYGLLSSGPPGPTTETPYPSYFGLLMLSHLAGPGDRMVRAASTDPLIAVHAVRHANGNLAILLINKDPSATHIASISIKGFSPAPAATAYTYAEQDSGLQSVSITAGSPLSISLPPYSMETVVLDPAK
jgi:hypothetical protein